MRRPWVEKVSEDVQTDGGWYQSCRMLHACPADRLLLLAGFRMFAVGVGNAVEDELREIASEPVAEHYFYTADFRTISKIGKKLQMKICIGESGGLGRRGDLVTESEGWKQEDKNASSNGCREQLSGVLGRIRRHQPFGWFPEPQPPYSSSISPSHKLLSPSLFPLPSFSCK